MAPRRKKPYRVFVSHATADKPMARLICERIEAIPGTATFRDDRDIEGGQSIPKSIRAAIRRSDQFLVLLTPTSLTRTWVIFEVGIAYGNNKLIVPICYNVEMDELSLLTLTKGYRFDDLDSYLDELRRRVRRKKR